MKKLAAEYLVTTGKIIDRAEKLGIIGMDRISLSMDLDSADETFDMRWEDLLEADNFNFAHDIIGIQDNIVRDSYPSTNFGFFIPRFGR